MALAAIASPLTKLIAAFQRLVSTIWETLFGGAGGRATKETKIPYIVNDAQLAAASFFLRPIPVKNTKYLTVNYSAMQPKLRLLRMMLGVILLLLITSFAYSQALSNVGPVTVTTDKPDYAPRSNAVFTGTGFLPGETVQLKVKNLFRACNTVTADSSYTPWTVIADASGGFVTNWTVCDCLGDSLRLRAVGQTSQYIAYAYFSDGNVRAQTNRSAATISATFYTSNNCSTGAGTTTNFNLNSSGFTSIGAADATQSFTLTAPTFSDEGGAFQSWSGAVSSPSTSVCVPGSGNSGNITMTANFASCTAPPTATLTSSDPDNKICTGESVTFTANNVTGATYIFYVDGVAQASASSTRTFTTSALSNGQTVTVRVINSGGCSKLSSGITTTVSPNNTVSVASSSPTVCMNTAIPGITHTTTGATGISNAGVSGASGLPAGVSATFASNTITISGTPTASGTFNYSIPLTGGCGSINATGTINVLQNGTLVKSPNTTSVCAGTSVSATLTPAAPLTITYADVEEYRYDGVGGWTTYTDGASLSTVGHTQVEIRTYRTAGATSCASSATVVSWSVTPLVTATFTAAPSSSVCTNTAVTYTTQSGKSNYIWTFTGVAGTDYTITSGGTTSSNTVTLEWLTTTVPSKTVTVTYTDGPCPITPASSTITVNARPSLTLNGSAAAVCYSTTAQTSSLGYSNPANNPSTYSITWDASPANAFVPVIDATLGASPVTISVPANTAVGTYTGHLTVKNSNGCTSSSYNFTITVNGLPTLTVQDLSIPCYGGTINLTTAVTSSTSGLTITYWTGSGAMTQVSDPTAVSFGTYFIRATNSNNCTTEKTVQVSQPAAALSASASAAPIACHDGTTTLTVTANGGTPGYTYSLNAGTPQSSNSFTVSAGDYVVTVKDANNCTVNTSSVHVNNPDAIQAPTGNATQTFCNTATVADLTATGQNILWYSSANGGSALSSTTALVNGAHYYASQTVGGCESSGRLDVTVTINTAPTVSATDINRSSDANTCGASVIFGANVTASGSPVPTITYKIGATSITSPHIFPVGTTKVTVIATNDCGSNSTTFDVTVEDKVAPVVVTKNITVQLDATGHATISDNAVNDGSSDNCTAAADLVFATDIKSFDCSNVGHPVTVTLTVTDANGNSATKTATVTVEDNQNPTITAPTAVSATTNTACTATGVALGTPVTADNCGVKSVTNDAPTAFPLGETTVTWTVEDKSGNKATATQVVTVTDNVNPTITDMPSNITVKSSEGNSTSCAQVANWVAPKATDNCSVISFTSDHQSGEAFPVGTTTVTYTAKDATGNTTTASFTVTVVDDTKPVWTTSTGSLNKTVYCGQGKNLEDAQALRPTASDNCAGEISINKNAGSFVPYGNGGAGTYTNTYTATDAAGNVSGVFTQVITVGGVSIDASATSDAIQLGTATKTLKATVLSGTTFIDGAKVTFTVTNNVNNIVTNVGGTPQSVTTANGSATYTLTTSSLPVGLYAVKAVVGDGCSQTVAYFSVFDPNAGFVTGGGWVNSPAGAYTKDPTLTGKANFGFNAQYKKGNNALDGNTEFQFSAGNLNFKSSNYAAGSLVIAGAKAIFQGVGTINGAGTYNFMISAIDGSVNGGGGTDKFRMRIWDTNGGLIYDNNKDLSNNADPATALGGGSIVIHENNSKKARLAADGVVVTEVTPEFSLRAYPNPSTSQFTVQIESSNRNEKIEVRVMDLNGRVVEMFHNLSANQTLKLGGNYRPGMYVVEMIQGNERKQLKLIKQAD